MGDELDEKKDVPGEGPINPQSGVHLISPEWRGAIGHYLQSSATKNLRSSPYIGGTSMARGGVNISAMKPILRHNSEVFRDIGRMRNTIGSHYKGTNVDSAEKLGTVLGAHEGAHASGAIDATISKEIADVIASNESNLGIDAVRSLIGTPAKDRAYLVSAPETMARVMELRYMLNEVGLLNKFGNPVSIPREILQSLPARQLKKTVGESGIKNLLRVLPVVGAAATAPAVLGSR